MTLATSVGPDVDAILGSDNSEVGTVVSSNFSESGAGQIEITPSTPPAEPAGDELLAGKFKTQDDLIKAYKSLESKLGQPAEEASAEENPEEPEGGEASLRMGSEEAEGEAGEETEARSSEDEEQGSGLDLSPFATEFAETGQLSDESFEALEKQGIPRVMVDQYIAGVQAIQSVRGEQLYAAAGGKDEFNAMVKWGTANLPQEQQDAFNAAVNTAIVEGDLTAASMLISGVKAQMGGSEPSLLNSNTGDAPGGVEPFSSRSDMANAMRDPRYSKDPAYVAEVQARLAVSDF